VSGLAAGQQLTLINNGTDTLTITANGAFIFSKRVAFNENYSVVVSKQPTGQTCSIASGIGSGVSANVQSVVVTCNNVVISTFDPNYLILPTAESLVANLCTTESKSGGWSVKLALSDLNVDGKLDIVSVYSCSYSSPGQSYNGPVPNTLIVFLSQSNGTYQIGNKQLFGSDLVDIGGFSNGFTVGDFNRDGKPDIGIGVSKEDSRANNSTFTAWNAPQVVLLSKSDGTYSVERFSVEAASGKVQAVDNETGGVDFVYPAVAQEPATAYRWNSGSWTKISGYPRTNVGMTFFGRSSAGNESKKVLTLSTTPEDGPASLQIQEKINGAWSITAKYVVPSKQVPIISWNGAQTQSSLATINNIRMTYATFEDSCIFKISPSSNDEIILARITGFPIPKDWDGVSPIDERTLASIAMLIPFSVGSTLTPMTDLFDVPVSDRLFTEFRCVDLNGDSYMDVVLNAQGANFRGTKGGPVFFLNNKAGKLVKTDILDLPAIPQSSTEWPDSSSQVYDIDGDGFADLLYYTTEGKPNPLGHWMRLYRGKKILGT
jgi:hypothetical protein